MINSGKLTSLARPYVSAAFEYALEQKDLDAWELFLKNASLIVQDPQLDKLLSQPHLNMDSIESLFKELLKNNLNETRTNFLKILVANQRLSLLPQIQTLFSQDVAEHNKSTLVKVISAVQLEKDFTEKLQNKLSQRFNKNVELQYEIDPSILGGIVIQNGDTVIDGSVKGKLNRLAEQIN